MPAPDHTALSVKALIWAGGAASTLVGSWLTSWLSSKTHSYQDARDKHRDELRERVLEPLRTALESEYANPNFSSEYAGPNFSVDWQAQRYKTNASLSETPVESGPALRWSDPTKGIEGKLEQALLEDARVTHHRELLWSWAKFRDSWSLHLRRRADWIQHMAEEILRWSGLPAFPLEPTGPYVKHLNLAKLIYNRLLLIPTAELHIEARNGAAVLSDYTTNYALGQREKVDNLLQFLNSLIELNKSRGSELEQELEELHSERKTLLRQFSLAISARRLRGRCLLVRFF